MLRPQRTAFGSTHYYAEGCKDAGRIVAREGLIVMTLREMEWGVGEYRREGDRSS